MTDPSLIDQREKAPAQPAAPSPAPVPSQAAPSRKRVEDPSILEKLETPESLWSQLKSKAQVFKGTAQATLSGLGETLPGKLYKKIVRAPSAPFRAAEEGFQSIEDNQIQKESKPVQLAFGVAHGLNRLAEGALEPENLALIVASVAAPEVMAGRVASGLFSASMLKNIPNLVKQYSEAKDISERGRIGTELAGSLWLAYGAGKNAIKDTGIRPGSDTVPPEQKTSDMIRAQKGAAEGDLKRKVDQFKETAFNPKTPPMLTMDKNLLPFDSKAEGMQKIEGPGFVAKPEVKQFEIDRAKKVADAEAARRNLAMKRYGGREVPALPEPAPKPVTPEPTIVPPDRRLEGPPKLDPSTKSTLERMTGKSVDEFRKEQLKKENMSLREKLNERAKKWLLEQTSKQEPSKGVKLSALNPISLVAELHRMAREADSYSSFRKAVSENPEIDDYLSKVKLDLRSVYNEKDKPGGSPVEPEAPAQAAPEKPSEPTATEKSPEQGQAPKVNTPPLKYIDESPLPLYNKPEKLTDQNLRDSFSGVQNSQKVKINNEVAAPVRQLVPDKTQREGLTLYRDVGGDKLKLMKALNNPKFEKYYPALRAALNMTPEMIKANGILDDYYRETGQVGQKYGFLKSLRDDYINRIYKPDSPQNYPKTETYRSGIPKSTYHAKERVFDSLLDAIEYGKTPATLDASELVTVHGGEFAKTLTNNKLYSTLEQVGLGMKVEEGKLPPGYEKLGNSNFAVPQALARGLRAITDPNYLNRLEGLKKVREYNALAKTGNLAYSLFHDFTMTVVYLNQHKFGADVPGSYDFLKRSDNNALEEDFTRHTGMTTNIDSNKDVMRQISEGNDLISKASKLPGFRTAFKLMDAHSEFLFGNLQRKLKIWDYGFKMEKWVKDHPGAADQEIINAKIGFAKEVNAAYGGLNWQSLGTSPTMISIGRLMLLAPDWTWSNIQLGKQALSDAGTTGSAARSHIISALIGPTILTEGLNKIITGHYTNKNKKGHELEVEIRPNTYISFYRGPIGDLIKLFYTFPKESGVVGGAARFLQGKLSPETRTLVGLLAKQDYNGKPMFKPENGFWKNTEDGLSFIARSGSPFPFAGSQVGDMIKQKETDPASYALVGTGLARWGYNKTLKSEGYDGFRDYFKKLRPIVAYDTYKKMNNDEKAAVQDLFEDKLNNLYSGRTKEETRDAVFSEMGQ